MRESTNKVLQTFLKRTPEAAHPFTLALMERFPVNLRLSAPRKTKWGDYRYGLRYTPTVSVNRDLPPPLFLLTFMHEMAHHIVQLDHGSRVSAHGLEWKNTFRKLMQPLLSPKVFEQDVLIVLVLHMRNPRASLAADPTLHELAVKLMHGEVTLVSDLTTGTLFRFRQRTYIRQETVRKRIRCFCTENERIYLFQPATPVEPI